MRIIVLSQLYQPEPEPKIHLLARDLAARGHQVTSITGLPNYPEGRVYEGYRVRPWPRSEERDGVRVVRVPLYADHSRSAARRVLNYASFAASAALMGPAASGPADVMWVYHPPLTVALPAMAIAAARRIPFAYEIQDMWPETLGATGMVRSPRVLEGVGAFARAVYRRADRLVVISPGFRRNLIEKGVPAEKIEVIPNWADEDLYRPVPRDEALARETGMAGKFNVLFTGNMGPAQGLGNLLDAAARLRDERAVQLVLVGDGIEEPALRRRVEAEGLDNVRFLGRVPPASVPPLCALADVLLVHLRADPLFEITIPSKTISYLACGRPILSVGAGDPADVVLAARAGVTCPPGNPEALAGAVRALARLPADERERLGRAARGHFLAHFTRAKLVERYEALLLAMIAARARRATAGGQAAT
jgi:glycosyltransferase involved in cell wall biosynthesis